jgi:hypothetical protein
MALIDTTTLLQIADRAARQYQYLADAFDALSAEGGGFYFDIVTATDDADVEVPLERGYEFVDDTLVSEGAPFAAKNGTRLVTIIGDMDNHFNRRDSSGAPLQQGGWDGYLASEDERVSDYFNQLYFAVRRQYMLAINVFSEGDDLFGSGELIAGPGITFTDGLNYGTGSDLNPANGNNFAGTQLKAVVDTMGATDLDLRLSVKDLNNNPTTIDVTIPGSSAPGTEISVGGTSDRFLDLIGMGFVPAGSNGTLGDVIEIRNLKERQIAL